jgi:hypothetical protein
MKWIAILFAAAAALVLAGLGLVGAGAVALPNTNDPFSQALRVRLGALNDTRRGIEWLADKARMAGKASELPQEKEAYDEIAARANAWLDEAGQNLGAKANEAALIREFDDQISPKAAKLYETLKQKGRWLGHQRMDAGIIRVLGADVDHLISVFGYGWDDLKTYVKLRAADGAQSKKIALSQLEEMKWLPWTEMIGVEF